jgi:toxin ParE1/3/4
MARFKLTPRAEQDLDQIYIFSHREFGERQAEAYLLSFEQCFEKLQASPGLGRSIEHIRPGYRRYNHGSHAVFITLIPEGILIVRVLHQRMDPERHL